MTSPFCTKGGDFMGGCSELEMYAAELLDLTPPAWTVSGVDAEASLARFQDIVRSNRFTIWIFWRGLW